jgi:hypothetical protein
VTARCTNRKLSTYQYGLLFTCYDLAHQIVPPRLVNGGVGILQYADDTVLCISHDPEKAVNLKLLLTIFELMSGLKINFLKSELFVIGGDRQCIGGILL